MAIPVTGTSNPDAGTPPSILASIRTMPRPPSISALTLDRATAPIHALSGSKRDQARGHAAPARPDGDGTLPGAGSATALPPDAQQTLNYFAGLAMQPGQRRAFLLAFLRECTPADMQFLYRTIPVLHRDFIRLLTQSSSPSGVQHIAIRIMSLLSPRDLCSVSQVSRPWLACIRTPAIWHTMYARMGLASMASIFFSERQSIRANALRLSTIRSWVGGVFRYSCVRVHAQGGAAAMCAIGGEVATVGGDRTCALLRVRTRQLLWQSAPLPAAPTAVVGNEALLVTGE